MTATNATKVIPAGIPFTQIPNTLILDLRIPHVAKCVYMYLMHRANTEGRCFPSMRLIAKELGMSTATVNKSMTILESTGWVAVNRQNREKGNANRPVNNYIVHGTNVAPNEQGVASRATSPVASRATEQHSPSNNTHEQEEGVASLAVFNPTTKPGTGIQLKRKRDELWDMFTEVHGNPASKSERGKYNRYVKQLRDADVTADEYPTLVAAYCRKYPDLQPAVATVAERIGELRHYRDRGPIRPPDADEIRNQEAMREALQEGTP